MHVLVASIKVIFHCYFKPLQYACVFFSEIFDGIAVFDENNNPLGMSKKAAYKSIVQVCTSRITMAAPGMCKLACYSGIGINTKGAL